MTVTTLQEEFSKYHVGQRVYYSGYTTYDKNVVNEPATIDVIGKCICVVLDDSRKITKDSYGVDVIPVEQRASIGLGDLKSGNKLLKPMFS